MAMSSTMKKRTQSNRDVGLLRQMHDDNQLLIASEFQRNSVWPPAAKAYLIDTVINDRPIPLLYFLRSTSAQTGRASYTVIDGQQRLRAVFDFINDQFALSQSDRRTNYYNKRF